jgi:hypothetical protein
MSRGRDKAGGARSQELAAPQCPPRPSLATASLEPSISSPWDPFGSCMKYPFRVPLLDWPQPPCHGVIAMNDLGSEPPAGGPDHHALSEGCAPSSDDLSPETKGR